MFCSNCGKQLPDDAKFCNYCGAVQNVNVQNAKGTTNKVPEQSGYEVKPRVEKPKVEKASSKSRFC